MIKQLILSGWWFGTMEFYVSHHIGNFIIPTDELTFFRGVYHQPDDDLIVDFVFFSTKWGCRMNRKW
jgi:hypothetical protein